MNGMTARRLRIVLAVIMFAIIAAAVVGFSIAQKNLADYANSISKLNADAQSGDQNIRTLQNLKVRLDQQQALIQRTRAVVGDSSTYANTVINDISRIGSESGVPVKSIAFVESAATVTPTAGAAAAPTTSASGSGVVKKTVTVSVQSPLSYTSLMNFLGKIESNELRMHVAKVAITEDEGDKVATQDLSIEVYVRQ
jgi:hypothetical protein